MTCSSITLLKFSFQISSSFYLSSLFFFFFLFEPPSLFNPCFSVELALVHGSLDTMNSSPTPVLTYQQQQQFLHAAAKCFFRLFSFIFSSHIPFLLPFSPSSIVWLWTQLYKHRTWKGKKFNIARTLRTQEISANKKKRGREIFEEKERGWKDEEKKRLKRIEF